MDFNPAIAGYSAAIYAGLNEYPDYFLTVWQYGKNRKFVNLIYLLLCQRHFWFQKPQLSPLSSGDFQAIGLLFFSSKVCLLSVE